MQDIEKEISKAYDLCIERVYPIKNYYVIETPTGNKILKSMDFSPERIMFVHGAKEHLYNNGFKNIDRYMCSKDGLPFLQINGRAYAITGETKGRECDLNKADDVIRASKTLAMLHKASKGYVPPENSLIRDDLGKIPAYFSKRLEEIKRTKKIAQREKSKFDYLILEYIDYFYELGQDAINKIHLSKYNEIVDRCRKEKSFCHHDYSHCNIICTERETKVINFDFCSFELKVYDVANLLRRKMRKCNWDVNGAKIIIDEYTSIEPITQEEFDVMKIMLQFPQKFWRVINRYYNSRRSKRGKNFMCRFNEAVEEIEYQKKFLKEFEL